MRTYRYIGVLFLFIFGVCHSHAQWISPSQYQEVLGQGIDVDWWSEGTDYSNCNWDQAISDFNDAGIRHIRITLHNDIMHPSDFNILDRQIDACIRHGISPIIAYRPTFAFSGTPLNYRRHLTDWWRSVALHYRGHSARLSFDLLFEPDMTMFGNYEDLNIFYEDCVAAIRVSNPCRILFIAPSHSSDPMYLRHLRLPSRHNGYLMAEWHFFARGEYGQAWIGWRNDRAAQSRWINERIQAALSWQRATGVYTWVGGWMPASYFDGGMSSIGDAYTSFMCEALAVAHIPFAVHGIARYYNYGSRNWQMHEHAPMRTIFPHGNFARSGRPVATPESSRGGFRIGGHSFARDGRGPEGMGRDNSYNRQGTPGFHIGSGPSSSGTNRSNFARDNRQNGAYNGGTPSQSSSYSSTGRNNFARGNRQNGTYNGGSDGNQQPTNIQDSNRNSSGGNVGGGSRVNSEDRRQDARSNGSFTRNRERNNVSNTGSSSRSNSMQERTESRQQRNASSSQGRTSQSQNNASDSPSPSRRGGGGVRR